LGFLNKSIIIDDNNRDTIRNDVLEYEQNLKYVLSRRSLLIKNNINNEY
jgi:hypothetical protein